MQTVEVDTIVNGKWGKSNKIITSYRKDDIMQLIAKANERNGILFADKKRSHFVVGSTELYLFSSRNFDFTNNIE